MSDFIETIINGIKAWVSAEIGKLNSTGGTDNVQSDWNQSDETAPDYVKNRPGGYYTTESVTTESTVVFATDQSAVGWAPVGDLSGHETATVEIDGVVYENVPVAYDSRINTYTVGDSTLTAYPFVINAPAYAGGGTFVPYSAATEAGSKTVKITVNKPTAHKFPAELLPDTVETTAVILKSSTTGSTKRFEITVDDTGTLTATEVTE